MEAVELNFLHAGRIPSPLERVVMAAAKAKASRHAVTPQLRPQGKVSLPVTSFVTLSGSDETNEFESPPGHRAEPPPPAAQQRPLTLLKSVRSRSKANYESRASEDVLRGVGQGRAVTACAGSALPLENKGVFARLDKSHIVHP